jgi:glycine betaine/proline transport system permease protein
MVLRGISQLDMGLATVGGVGIVLLAITLDRITQAMGQPDRGARHWWQTGPPGLVLRLLRPAKPKSAAALAPTAVANSAPVPVPAATGAEPQGA